MTPSGRRAGCSMACATKKDDLKVDCGQTRRRTHDRTECKAFRVQGFAFMAKRFSLQLLHLVAASKTQQCAGRQHYAERKCPKLRPTWGALRRLRYKEACKGRISV